MTQPIQEPNTQRSLQGLAYARDQIFRRPSPVAAASGENAWAAISTEPIGFEHTGSGDALVDWYTLWISDNALGTIFSYEVDPGGGQFGDNRGWLTLLVDNALLGFTIRYHVTDLDNGGPNQFVFFSSTVVTQQSYGKFPGGTGIYPGAYEFKEQWPVLGGFGTDLDYSRTWTVPVVNTAGEVRIGETRFSYTPQAAGQVWTIRLYITYLGPTNWSTAGFDDANSTWYYLDT
jgi:hypothetical protein